MSGISNCSSIIMEKAKEIFGTGSNSDGLSSSDLVADPHYIPSSSEEIDEKGSVEEIDQSNYENFYNEQKRLTNIATQGTTGV
ncbi:hypothetical protein FQA39_LY08549 [Lamprigera yunnana]|nr:hypothetical protein FQA39_LY08549 [Lamprigera yunnana]